MTDDKALKTSKAVVAISTISATHLAKTVVEEMTIDDFPRNHQLVMTYMKFLETEARNIKIRYVAYMGGIPCKCSICEEDKTGAGCKSLMANLTK